MHWTEFQSSKDRFVVDRYCQFDWPPFPTEASHVLCRQHLTVQELFENYTLFEKKYGDRAGVEDVIISKRRFQYEEEVSLLFTPPIFPICMVGLPYVYSFFFDSTSLHQLYLYCPCITIW